MLHEKNIPLKGMLKEHSTFEFMETLKNMVFSKYQNTNNTQLRSFSPYLPKVLIIIHIIQKNVVDSILIFKI